MASWTVCQAVEQISGMVSTALITPRMEVELEKAASSDSLVALQDSGICTDQVDSYLLLGQAGSLANLVTIQLPPEAERLIEDKIL